MMSRGNRRLASCREPAADSSRGSDHRLDPADGRVFVADQPVNSSCSRTAWRHDVGKPDAVVYLRADEGLRYGDVIRVVDVISGGDRSHRLRLCATGGEATGERGVDRLIASANGWTRLPGTVLVSMVAPLLAIGTGPVLPRSCRDNPCCASPMASRSCCPRWRRIAVGGRSAAPVVSAPPPAPTVLKPPATAPRPNGTAGAGFEARPKRSPRRRQHRRPRRRRRAPPRRLRASSSARPALRGRTARTPAETGTLPVCAEDLDARNQQIKAGFTQPIGVTFTIIPTAASRTSPVTQRAAQPCSTCGPSGRLNAAPFAASEGTWSDPPEPYVHSSGLRPSVFVAIPCVVLALAGLLGSRRPGCAGVAARRADRDRGVHPALAVPECVPRSATAWRARPCAEHHEVCATTSP